MTPNTALFKKIHEQILRNEQGHNQSAWVLGLRGGTIMSADDNLCGTSACVAGWAVLLSGGRFRQLPDYTNQVQYKPRGRWTHLRSVEDRAAELLGIGEHFANLLFFCSNEQAREIVAQMAAGKSETVARKNAFGSAHTTPTVQF